MPLGVSGQDVAPPYRIALGWGCCEPGTPHSTPEGTFPYLPLPIRLPAEVDLSTLQGNWCGQGVPVRGDEQSEEESREASGSSWSPRTAGWGMGSGDGQ